MTPEERAAEEDEAMMEALENQDEEYDWAAAEWQFEQERSAAAEGV